MKLTEEQFSHLTIALGCTEGQSVQENRGRIRVPMGTRATIIPCSETGRGEITTIVVLNISDAGIGILNAVQMRAGEQFILRLPATMHQRAGAIQCSVMYSQSIPEGMWAIGRAQFVRVLTVKHDLTVEPEVLISREHDLAHVREVEDRLSRLSL